MKFLATIKNKIASWRRSEPVRTTVYPILVLGLGVLVSTGRITLDTSTAIDGVVALILGITATEAARAKVTPQAKATQTVIDVVEEVRKVGASPEVQAILERARTAAEDAIGRHRSRA